MWDKYGVRKTLARHPSLRVGGRRTRVWLAALGSAVLCLAAAATWKATRKSAPRRSDAALPAGRRSTPMARPERLLVLGVNPTFEVSEVRKTASEFASDVSGLSGLDVRAVVGTSYNDLIDGMHLGELDAVFVTPVAYVKSGLINVSRPVLRIVRNPHSQDTYYSALVAKRGGLVGQGLESLCGRRIGYTELDSSSGFIFAKLTLLQYLDKKKLSSCDLSHEVFLGGHKAVLDAVAQGEVDAGAVFASDAQGKSGAWTQLGDYPLSAMAVSEPIPSDGLFLRLSVGERKARDFVSGLQEYMRSETGRRKFKRLFGADGLIKARVGDYNSVVGALSRFEKLSQKYGKAGSAE